MNQTYIKFLEESKDFLDQMVKKSYNSSFEFETLFVNFLKENYTVLNYAVFKFKNYHKNKKNQIEFIKRFSTSSEVTDSDFLDSEIFKLFLQQKVCAEFVANSKLNTETVLLCSLLNNASLSAILEKADSLRARFILHAEEGVLNAATPIPETMPNNK